MKIRLRDEFLVSAGSETSKRRCTVASFRRSLVSLLFFCSFLILNTLYAAPANNLKPELPLRTVKVGLYPMPGFHNFDKKGIAGGYGYDYLQCLRRYTPWKYQYPDRKFGWQDTLGMLERGEIDLLGGVPKTPEREAKFAFSEYPMGKTSTILTVRAGNNKFLIGDYRNWNGIRVGIVRDDIRRAGMERLAKEKGFQWECVIYADNFELAEALQKGVRIDASLTTGLREFDHEWILEQFDVMDCYFVTRKDEAQLLRELSFGQEQLEVQNPDLQNFLRRKYYTKSTAGQIVFTADEKAFIDAMRASKHVFKAVLNPQCEPFSWYENSANHGIFKDFADAITERTGLTIQILPIATREDYRKACADPKVDIVWDSLLRYPEAEKQDVVLTNPYFTATVSLLSAKDGPAVPKTVAFVESSRLLEDSADHFPKDTVFRICKSQEEAVKSVLSGENDAFCTYTGIAEFILREDGYNQLVAKYISDWKSDFAVAVRSSRNYLLPSIINKAVLSLSPELSANLRRKYAPPPSSGFTFLRMIQLYPKSFAGTVLALSFLLIFLVWYIFVSRKVSYRMGGLLARLPFHSFVISKDGRFLYYNFGVTTKFVRTRFASIADIPDAEIRKLMREKVAFVLATGETVMTDFAFENRHRSVSVYKLPMKMFGRETVLWLSQDVTDLYRSKQEARKNENICRLTLQSVGDGILTTDVDGKVVMLNPVAEHMIGISQADAVGRLHDEIFQIVSSVDHVRMDSPISRSLRTGATVELANHTMLISLDKTRMYHIADSSAPIHDEQGKVIGAILVFRDVSEEYRRRAAMQLEVANWEAASDIAKIYRFQYNVKTRAVTGSRNLSGIWPVENGVAVPAKEWILPEDLDSWNAILSEIIAGSKTNGVLEYRVLQNGKLRYFRMCMRKTKESSEEIAGLVQEITDFVAIQKEQSSTMALWQTSINTAPALMFVKDASRDFRYMQCNERFAEFVGRPQEEIIGKTDAELFRRPQDAEMFRQWDQRVMDFGTAQDFHESALAGDGTVRYFSTVKFPAKGPSGEPLLIGMGMDETKDRERSIALQALLKSWRAASAIAQIVAYRFNPTTCVMSGTENLEKYWPVFDHVAAPPAGWVHPDDVPMCDRIFADIKAGNLVSHSFTYRAGHGEHIRWYRQFFQRDPENPEEYTGLIQDITTQMREQKKQENILSMWKTVVDAIPLLLFVKDAEKDFKFLQVNRNTAKLFKTNVEDMIGRELEQITGNAEDCRKVRKSDSRVLETNRSANFFEEMHDADGVLHHFKTVKLPARDADGRRVLIQMSQDITAFQELSEVRQVVTYAFEQLFSTNDLETGIRAILKRVCDFIGFSRGYVCCVDEAENTVRIFTSYIPDGEKSIFNGRKFLIREAKELPWYRTMMNSQRNEVFQCDFTDPKDCERARIHCPGVLERAREFDVRGIHVNYIIVDGKPWGNVGFLTEGQPLKKLTENEHKLLEMTAHIIELAISRRQTFKQLETALRDAQAADKAKSFFLASMSHEIRTPLNAVIGFSELLKDADLDRATHDEYISGISLAGNALLQLINDILDLSRLESGQVEFVQEKTDFAEFARELSAVFQNGANQKNLKLTFNVAGLPDIYIDQQRIRQILFNLIGNSLKFTKTGGITVTASFYRTSEEKGTFTLIVSDTGIGIAPEDQRKLFKPFVQLTRMRGTNANNNGTGLGLSIVLKMVKQMGGEIKLDSELNTGSTFTISLPNVKFENRETAVIPGASAFTSGLCPIDVTPKILLVDDTAMNLKIMGSMLKHLCVPFKTASSGKQALEMLKQESFNIVLTDLLMPEMSGEDLSRAIRAIPEYASIRIGVITAESDRTAYETKLFDAILPKPITRDDLYNYLYGSTGDEA